MKRQTEKCLERIEKKRRKVRAFLDLIEGKTGLEDSSYKASEDYTSSLQELRELRKKTQELWKNTPSFKLRDCGIKARSLQCEEPLSHFDVQCLLLSSLIPKYYQPQQPFYELQRSQCASKVAIFILDGVDIDFVNKESKFFTEVLKYETVDDWVTKLLYVPMSNRKMGSEKNGKKGSEKNGKMGFDKNLIMEFKYEKKYKDTEPNLTAVSKTDLLLSLKQMHREGYPLPDGENTYKTTKKSYTPVTNESPMFGVDCEMCMSVNGNSVVTHIAVVNEKLEVLLKTYVKPDEPIKDYLTQWSGVKKKHLKGCNVSLQWVHEQLEKILPSDAILCGQSLQFDLKALGLIHPYIIDTSVIYSLSGVSALKPSLKTLSSVFLDEEIQKAETGHCPSEDAKAALKLAQLKLSKGLEFGDRTYGLKAGGISTYLPLVSYANLFDIKVNVFYDYLELENESKFVCVMTSFHKDLMSQIMKALSTDKCICLVISKELCCVRV